MLRDRPAPAHGRSSLNNDFVQGERARSVQRAGSGEDGLEAKPGREHAENQRTGEGVEISAVVKMDEQERRGQFREHVPGGSIFVSRGGSILASVEGYEIVYLFDCNKLTPTSLRWHCL